MKTSFGFASCAVAAYAATQLVVIAQPYDITTFDPTSQGPWSTLASTTLLVPKVANNGVTIDGDITSAEYGGFGAVTVAPGEGSNAWILDFPGDRVWDGPEDSSFSFYLAHDDNYLYIGVDTKDDIINGDDPNAAFWKDDAIEIVVDALNDRLDKNTDATKDSYGGHNYVNYQGRFSAWDDETGAINVNSAWATALTDWTYGASGDVYGAGKTNATGWKMEVRIKKRMFEDPAAGNKLRNGYVMGFNIGLDDDDKKGQGTNGDKSRGEDLEIQYFWANRQRYLGLTPDYLAGLTPDEIALKVWRTDTATYPLTIDSNGRLTHGGTGEIIFGYDADKKSTGKILFLCNNADVPVSADAGLIALLRGKGYTVTPYNTTGPTPDEMRAAAEGQDVILISESLGSGTVLESVGDPPLMKFIFRDVDIPVISYEAFMWDNAEFTQHPEDYSNEFSFFGNTGRTEDTQAEEIKDLRDSVYIKKPEHPIAGGLTGKVKVYNTPYSVNYGKPSADADVIATVQENGDYPSIFVYDKGDKLADGSVCPNKRICIYLGQVAALVANWNPEIGWLTDEGKALIFNTINYAIGTKTAPTISIAKSGANVVVTYAGGTLQSSTTLNGTYTNEAGTSPLTVTNPTGTKYYRVSAQ